MTEIVVYQPLLPLYFTICQLYQLYIFILFFLSLYPSAQSLALPFCQYTLMNENLHKKSFLNLSEKLISTDSAFFASKATNDHTSYLFEVDIVFDKNSVMLHSLDFSNFPTICVTDKDELSYSQRYDYEKSHSKTAKIPKKLVSDIRDGVYVEHIDVLMFMIAFYGAKITRVKSIISFKIYDFLKPFSLKMSKLRASTPSSVLKSTYKVYSNCICGKLHAGQNSYLSTTVIDSESAFDEALENPNFYDIIPLGKSCALALSDGQVLYDRTVKSISSKIYSTSKVPCLLCRSVRPSVRHILSSNLFSLYWSYPNTHY